MAQVLWQESEEDRMERERLWKVNRELPHLQEYVSLGGKTFGCKSLTARFMEIIKVVRSGHPVHWKGKNYGIVLLPDAEYKRLCDLARQPEGADEIPNPLKPCAE